MAGLPRIPISSGVSVLGTDTGEDVGDSWSTASKDSLTSGIAPREDDLFSREEWKLASRVAASKGLSKSDLLPRFLLHVCELSLRGRVHEITEQRIGTVIFNRPHGYSPGEDNIVRSYARLLRKRLEEYFAGEGATEVLRIKIPRGGYVPVFELTGSQPFERMSSDMATEIVSEELTDPLPYQSGLNKAGSGRTYSEPATHTPSIRKVGWMAGIGGLLLGLLLATAGWLKWNMLKPPGDRSAAHEIWTQLFQQNRNTLIVPADSGLGILENLSRRTVTVDQYANESYLPEMARAAGLDDRNFNDLGHQRYTSVVDLDIVARLARLPEYLASRTQTRYARSVTIDDIKDSNAILIGSKHTNPWVALFEKNMNFTLEYTSTVDESYIVNQAPVGSEQRIYRNGSYDSSGPTYGVIAYLPNLDGAGHVLIIEGLNMAATQAAAEILFNPKIIGPQLQRARLPNGTVRPFELLVQTNSIAATSPGAQILATRIHEQ